MLKVGICDDSIRCPTCKKRLKSTSKIVPWSTSSGKKVDKRTSGFVCNLCNGFYVIKGMDKDDSAWDTLYLVTGNSEKPKKKKTFTKNNLTIKEQKKIYPARFPDSKSCQNCNFYTKHGRCVTHSLNVEADDLCSRYQNYKPRIHLGGAFSPR